MSKRADKARLLLVLLVASAGAAYNNLAAWWFAADIFPLDRFANVFVETCQALTMGPFRLYEASNSTLTRTMLTAKRLGEAQFLVFPYPWIDRDLEVSWVELPVEGETAKTHRVVSVRPQSEPIERKLPLIIFFHKGGWVCGNANEREVIPQMVRDLNAAVVSIEYPLSPETVFPTAFEFGLETVLFLLREQEKSEQLLGGIDYSRVVLSGFSAGGNLCSAVTYHLMTQHVTGNLEKDGFRIRGNFIISSALQFHRVLEVGVDSMTPEEMRTVSTEYPSLFQHGRLPALHFDDMRFFWRQYFPFPSARCREDSRCSILTPPNKRFEAMPPVIVFVGDHDILRDENIRYFEVLRKHNNETVLFLAKGTHLGAVLFDFEKRAAAFARLKRMVYG